jgi:hypothetical protein
MIPRLFCKDRVQATPAKLFKLPIRLLIVTSIFARSTVTIQDFGFASAGHKTVTSRKQRRKQICCVAQEQ